jgi:alanine racemase
MHTRPIWAEISRSRLASNFRALQAAAAPHADLLAVVKADAYGHGVTLCAPWLVEAGAQWLGVTSVEEGLLVRKHCPQARILVLCGFWPGDEDALMEYALTPTVWTEQHITLLARAAERRKLPPQSVPVHLEVDTGMTRQGAALEELPGVLAHLRAASSLRLDGVFTHFASPEILNSPQNDEQQARFAQALTMVEAEGLHPAWVHAGNSSTLLAQDRLPAFAALAQRLGARFLVRPGLALYGYALPFVQQDGSSARALPVPLQPVLAWKTRIAALRTVEAGTAIGYGATYIAKHTMRLALLPVGYADGLNRGLSSRGQVLMHGQRVPIVGRVSMDLTVVDVTEVPQASVGGEVMLIGAHGQAQEPASQNALANPVRVTAEDHAHWAGTIAYEILCAISVRVPRIGAA